MSKNYIFVTLPFTLSILQERLELIRSMDIEKAYPDSGGMSRFLHNFSWQN